MKLNAKARQAIEDFGFTVAQYIAYNGEGDQCGCIDDRCANGFHHDYVDDCGCLPVLLQQMAKEMTCSCGHTPSQHYKYFKQRPCGSCDCPEIDQTTEYRNPI